MYSGIRYIVVYIITRILGIVAGVLPTKKISTPFSSSAIESTDLLGFIASTKALVLTIVNFFLFLFLFLFVLGYACFMPFTDLWTFSEFSDALQNLASVFVICVTNY
jgi:hypothetical protein